MAGFMENLFGYKIVRKDEHEKAKESFVAKEESDGALNVQASGAGGTIGQFLDLDKNAANEAELITQYRKLALNPEVEYAVDEIVNEAIASNESEQVALDLDNVEEKIVGAKTKDVIQKEFDQITNLLDFRNNSYELFRRWIIDGRMYFHAIINEQQPSAGVVEARYIDPRKLRKVRELHEVKSNNGVLVKKVKNEYWIYNDQGFGTKNNQLNSTIGSLQGLKISLDSIISVTSGLMDENNKMVYSYLHKAIRPMNQLRSLEDSTLIYHLSRAPERRVFYIDVGNLPKPKAEQHLNDIMTKFKNKVVYDQSTGKVKDDRKHMTMLEDFYLARRDGKGTQIDTIQGGTQLPELLETVEAWTKRLHKALNLPLSRLEESSGFNIGRPSEISRDEVKFEKFISRLRLKFSQIFLQLLEKQLILKQIITPEEWYMIKNDIKFNFAIDNHYAELKNMDIQMSRMDVVERMDPFIGRFFSEAYIRKHILFQTEEEIEEINSQIENEAPPPGTEEEMMDQEPEPKPEPKPEQQTLKIKHEVSK